ncbi:DEAD/DEAH box helicase [Demetria terragena]|uniref:DEAD/DEAH box helicase n=1 Tax=Demetria terragena TaxID=63959 RepID=UPI0003A8937C|nr:type ISP restriction/modification enzyme [Demetria terragena]
MGTATVYDVLDELRAQSTSEADKGSKFERLIEEFLRTDPVYANQFSQVWHWNDWPGREGKHDTGIDLVATNKVSGGTVAIQCKFYAPESTISKADIDTFLSASGKAGFTERMIVSTTDKWNQHAEDTIQGQQVPVTRVGMADLEHSVVNWDDFDWKLPQVLSKLAKKKLRPHQTEAVEKVTAGFVAHDRGKLIMACGTGKTFTSLRLAEQYAGPGKSVLFLVPSISLMSQTLTEWAAEAHAPMTALAVCSDRKVTTRSKAVNEDISAVDLPLPATTDVERLVPQLKNAFAEDDSMTVVFSTYQSIDVVSNAQKAAGVGAFDLIICDEAHRTTGVTIAGADESSFVKVHDNDFLPGTKRLYMTATPRLFGEDTKKKAAEGAAQIASMDDEEKFGPELYRLGFGEAVEKNLLTDYRVLILTVDEKYVTSQFQQELAELGEIPLGDAARMVGCWNGLAKHFDTLEGESRAPMKRAVAFAKDIKTSKSVAEAFPTIVDRHVDTVDLTEPEADDRGHRSSDLRVECEHVDGTYNALERNKKLSWLKEEPAEGTCRVLSNARCLSEGVDVPSLDTVMFLTARSSEVDVVQSVGRVMRKSPGKDYGYIILPIAVPSGTPPEEALADNKKYQVVWQVLRALRAHDDRFNSIINTIDLNKSKKNPRLGIGSVDSTGQVHSGDEQSKATQGPLELDFSQWQDAIYAKIVQKVGERRYWETWANDVATIAGQHIARINGILDDPNSPAAQAFDTFLHGLRGNLNDGITQTDAVEMLAQHLITRPIFDALFGGYDFAKHNPVAQAMETMLATLDEHSLDAENSDLRGFYDSVRSRVEGIDNAEGRQRIIVELYDKFFATAFSKTVDKLGIVYTPVEVVDFILRSADHVLREHFGHGITDKGVHVLDGFTGTGTFIVRLLQLGLISPEDLARKYARELHANEMLLLAYYIAAANIETTYQDLRGDLAETGDYEPFPGLILTDTFQSWEKGDRLDTIVFQQNNQRLEELKKLDIQVIVGNPPYSSGQDSANDNNANESYPDLDEAIEQTYATRSAAKLKISLYDSYIRAIKWASLRLHDRGVIAYVTNGGWLDSNSADGMRKSLAEEFSDIYVYNLRGNQRTAGEQSRKEGGKIFGAGSRATVAITLLIKDPTHTGPARIHYTDIGDYLTREQKLERISHAGSIEHLDATAITPNTDGDWLNQRSIDFPTFMAVGDKDNPDRAVFGLYSGGVKTNRDAWVYNFHARAVAKNMRRTIDFCNQLTNDYAGSPSPDFFSLGEHSDPSKISWDEKNRKDVQRGRRTSFDSNVIRSSTYRPFTKTSLYFDRAWNNSVYRLNELFPTPGHPNHGFVAIAPRVEATPAVLMVDQIPDLSFYSYTGQFFARWRYEKVDDADGTLSIDTSSSSSSSSEVIDGYLRIDNITDHALSQFQGAYGERITKDDIFNYVYGLLHAPDYRTRYAADLKKSLPRIPLVADAQPFIDAGRRLSEIHLAYETVEPYPLEGLDAEPPQGSDPYEYYAVGNKEMRFGKLPKEPAERQAADDRSTITYNTNITLTGIPEDAYRYMLGSKSAIEWIIARYYIKTDKPSGIVNDPNDWSREVGDPRYILDLLARVVTVSVETNTIVDALPSLDIRMPSPGAK